MSALDSSLTAFLVKATLILVVVLAAHLTLKRSSAATRHLVLTLAMCGLFALPLLALSMPAWQLEVLPQAVAKPIAASTPVAVEDEWVAGGVSSSSPAVSSPSPVDHRPEVSAVAPAWRIDPSRALYGAWALGAALVLARLLVGLLRMRGIVHSGNELTDPALLRILDECREALNLKARPRLVASARVEVPLVMGWLRPVLVVPTEFTAWDDDRVRAVLLHELGHLKRNDWPVLVLGRVVAAVYWFHPLAWCVERCARRECERACDDLVVASGARPSDYASHLLSIARGLLHKPVGVVATLAVVRPSQLKTRLHSILDPLLRRNAPSRRAVASLSTALALVLVPVAGMQLAEPALAEGPAEPDEVLLAQYSEQKDEQFGTHYSKKAYELHQLGRYEEAIELFREALDEGHNPGASMFNIACCHALLGDAVAAMDWLEQAAEAGFDDPRSLVKDSDFDPIRSDARFQEFIDSAFRTAGVERSYPKYYPYRATLEKLDELKSSNSADAKLWAKVGHQLLSFGELDRAVEAYNRAIELSDGTDTTTMYNLACAYSLAGRSGAALDWLERSVDAGFDNQERFDNDSDLDSLRGNARFDRIVAKSEFLSLKRFSSKHGDDSNYSRERWAPAVVEFREFVSENPSHGRAWFNLGFALHGSREFEEAIAAFEKAVRFGYHPNTANFNIACANAMLGRTDAALGLLEALAESDGANYGQLHSDSDLDSLREEPRFEALLESLEEQQHLYKIKVKEKELKQYQMKLEMKQSDESRS
jgi:beta-lactamase regulating signal transducer with metallopeptidase domain/Flp pilus assembly protein TadD